MKLKSLIVASILLGAIVSAVHAADYTAEYWDTAAVATPSIPGTAADLTETTSTINYNWGTGSPVGDGDGFIARWTKTETFDAGAYVFTLTSDDGSRFYLDDSIKINMWVDQSTTTSTDTEVITAGSHDIRVEYYENTGDAVAKFSYERTDPQVSAYFPADGATGVTTTANFILTFDEAVDAETGNITIYDASDDSEVEAIDVTSGLVTGSGSASIEINPSTTLTEKSSYYVQVAGTAFDDSGSNSYLGISDSTTWNFTIGDFTNPTASAYFPADDGTGVTTTASLILTFDEAVDVETGNIIIYNASDDSVYETIDVTSDQVTGSGSTTIVIDPTDDFSYESSYYVQIDATAFDDTSSNSYAGITDTTTWNFTILDLPDCPSVDNAVTYNSYPTCGAATCASNYKAVNGTCAVTGGGGFSAPVSAGTGSMVREVPMSNEQSIGELTFEGVNIFMYINSIARFDVMRGHMPEPHSLEITGLDMLNQRITVRIQSEPIELELELSEQHEVDLDNDGSNDILVSFNKLEGNKIDITITQLEPAIESEESTTNSDPEQEQELIIEDGALIKFPDYPAVYVVRNGLKHAFINELAFISHGYQWQDIQEVHISQFPDGDMIYPVTDDVQEVTKTPTQTMEETDSMDNEISVTPPAFEFYRNLFYGTSGEDVRALQKFLNQNGFLVSETGSGSLGNESIHFRRKTRDALQHFQSAHNINPASGYFGPITRRYIESE